ncbi:TlpA family protein disulfide reductase [Mesoterricola silvestris]|uniref:Thioredoxin domain-containing protein n=1 Tax=Mesoterricola silvestris TaxID=2927979 RepID=A0AA48GK37_9BACT|nr:TlpA disulfide reductase family protein [Mesoterricola silvestris]BDU72792.1 hypothetical protein METEAL_19660 [Mesoterricola silvestris]
MNLCSLAFLLCLPLAASDAEAVLAAAQAKGQAVAKARAAHVEAGRNSMDFKADVAKELAGVTARLATETDPAVRQALRVTQLYYLRLARQTPTAEQVALALKEVPPTSAAWALDKGLLPALGDWAPREAASYLAEARAHQPDGPTRRNLLFEHFTVGVDTGTEADWKPSFEALQKDFPGSTEALKAQDRLKAELKTAVGVQAPPFSLTSLEGAPLSLDTFKGQFVLIDFWATWCPDCRAGMPYLMRAQARFKDKGLKVLSLSFDRKVEHIAPYRANPATSMPWTHAFLPQGFKNPISEAYGVRSIPKPVLVGPDGRIVATGGDLHGEKLEKTLERILGR